MSNDKKEKTLQEKVADFQKDYEAVCAKHGLQLAMTPQWKQSMDTGTYSLVIAVQVAEYKPEKP